MLYPLKQWCFLDFTRLIGTECHSDGTCDVVIAPSANECDPLLVENIFFFYLWVTKITCNCLTTSILLNPKQALLLCCNLFFQINFSKYLCSVYIWIPLPILLFREAIIKWMHAQCQSINIVGTPWVLEVLLDLCLGSIHLVVLFMIHTF